MTAQVTYSSQHINLNSQFYALNPFTSGDLDLQVTQNLLQGFGRAVNGRNIRVQNNNVKVSSLQFEQQVATTVSGALDLYWDLVSFEENVRAREQAVATAQQLVSDNKNQVDAGSLAPIEVTRAESQVYAAQQDLVVAQTNLLQQETILKNVLCRDGIRAAGLANIRLLPLDRLVVPDKDELPFRRRAEQASSGSSDRTGPGAAQSGKQPDEPGGHQEFPEADAAGVRRIDQQWTHRRTERARRTSPGLGYLAGGYGNLLAQIAAAITRIIRPVSLSTSHFATGLRRPIMSPAFWNCGKMS